MEFIALLLCCAILTYAGLWIGTELNYGSVFYRFIALAVTFAIFADVVIAGPLSSFVGSFSAHSALHKAIYYGYMAICLVAALVTMSVLFYVIRPMIPRSTEHKLRRGVMVAGGGAASYVVGHLVFGFGIPEASIAAFLAAGTLGFIGFTA